MPFRKRKLCCITSVFMFHLFYYFDVDCWTCVFISLLQSRICLYKSSTILFMSLEAFYNLVCVFTSLLQSWICLSKPSTILNVSLQVFYNLERVFTSLLQSWVILWCFRPANEKKLLEKLCFRPEKQKKTVKKFRLHISNLNK